MNRKTFLSSLILLGLSPELILRPRKIWVPCGIDFTIKRLYEGHVVQNDWSKVINGNMKAGNNYKYAIYSVDGRGQIEILHTFFEGYQDLFQSFMITKSI